MAMLIDWEGPREEEGGGVSIAVEGGGGEAASTMAYPGKPLPIGVAVRMEQGKGRFLVACRECAPGDIIFKDEAIVSASWDPEEVLSIANIVADPSSTGGTAHANAVLQNVKSCMNELEVDLCKAIWSDGEDEEESEGDEEDSCPSECEEDGFLDVLDRARCLILAIFGYSSNAHMRDIFSALTVANLDKARRTIARASELETVRRSGLFDVVGQDTAAHILGVLNTNSHGLDSGGSATFPVGSLLNHSCVPNCHYHTRKKGQKVFFSLMAATQISAGTPLTIDYENLFYRPREARASMLQRFNFKCTCPACVDQADVCRGFVHDCGSSKGVCYPPQWICNSCGAEISEAERERFLREEDSVCLLSEEHVDRAIAAGVLHASHHRFFWCLYALAEMAVEHAMPEAVRLLTRVLASCDGVVPMHHPERLRLWDNLAQVHVTEGNHDDAVVAWQRALEVANICGDLELRSEIQELIKKPPRDSVELSKRYSSQS